MQTTNASIREKAECIIVVNTEDANISNLDLIQTPIRTLEDLFFGICCPPPPRSCILLTVVCFNLNKICGEGKKKTLH